MGLMLRPPKLMIHIYFGELPSRVVVPGDARRGSAYQAEVRSRALDWRKEEEPGQGLIKYRLAFTSYLFTLQELLRRVSRLCSPGERVGNIRELRKAELRRA